MHKLYFEEKGEGKLIILIPGFLGSVYFWDEIYDVLASKNKVVRLELLGFGRSPKPKDSTYTFSDQADCIQYTLADVLKGQKFILVGDSMGALVSIVLAERYEDQIEKLVLISPTLYKDEKEADSYINKSEFAKFNLIHGSFARLTCDLVRFFNPLFRFFTPIFYRRLPKKVVADFFLHTWDSFSKSLESIRNQKLFGLLNKISVPTVILYGDKDDLISEDNLAKLSKKIKIVKTSGTHMLPHEDPQKVIGVISG